MRELLQRYIDESRTKTKAEALMWILLQVEDQPFLISDQVLSEVWGWEIEEVKAFLAECQESEVLDFDGTGKGWIIIQRKGKPDWFATQTIDSTNGAANGSVKHRDDRSLAMQEVKQMLDKEAASIEERKMLNELRKIENYPITYLKDLALIRRLLIDYPDVNLLEEIKRFAIYKLDKPLKKNSNARSQLHNWVKNASKWGRENEKHTKSDQTIRRSEEKIVPQGKFAHLRKRQLGV